MSYYLYTKNIFLDQFGQMWSYSCVLSSSFKVVNRLSKGEILPYSLWIWSSVLPKTLSTAFIAQSEDNVRSWMTPMYEPDQWKKDATGCKYRNVTWRKATVSSWFKLINLYWSIFQEPCTLFASSLSFLEAKTNFWFYFWPLKPVRSL